MITDFHSTEASEVTPSFAADDKQIMPAAAGASDFRHNGSYVATQVANIEARKFIANLTATTVELDLVTATGGEIDNTISDTQPGGAVQSQEPDAEPGVDHLMMPDVSDDSSDVDYDLLDMYVDAACQSRPQTRS